MLGAEQLLRKAIEHCPNHARAWSTLGMTLWEQNRIDESINVLKTAVTLGPDLAGSRVNLGIALYLGGAIDDSITQYREAIRLVPDHPQAHLNLLMAILNTWADSSLKCNRVMMRV